MPLLCNVSRFRVCILRSPACAAFLLLLALALCGCGGGASQAGSGQSKGTLYPLATVTRTLQAGDTYTYQAIGTQYGTYGSQVVNSTYTNKIGTTTYNGAAALTQEDGFLANTYFVRQNADHSLTYVGAGQGFCAASATCGIGDSQTALFGQWHTNDKFTFALKDLSVSNSQTVLAATVQIVGTEEVDIPLGRFMTWKVQVTYDTNALEYKGFKETYWYAPQLGAYVKRVSTGASQLGFESSEDATSTLTATSVPLS